MTRSFRRGQAVPLRADLRTAVAYRELPDAAEVDPAIQVLARARAVSLPPLQRRLLYSNPLLRAAFLFV